MGTPTRHDLLSPSMIAIGSTTHDRQRISRQLFLWVSSINMSEVAPPISNDERINQLTLELLLNNTHYRKYMSKAHPVEYEKQKKQCAQFELYEPQISQLVMDLIDHYASGESDVAAPTREIQTTFHAFADACMDYFSRHVDVASPCEIDDGCDESDPAAITHFSVKKRGSPVPFLSLDNLDDHPTNDIPSPPLLRRSVHDTFLFPSPEPRESSTLSHASSFAPSYTLRSYFKTEHGFI